MFWRSIFAFPFLPSRQLLNLLSEATPKASLEDTNSPPLSHSADGSASLETFLGAALRSGRQSTLLHLKIPLSHIPGQTQVHSLAQSLAWRYWPCHQVHLPQQVFGWSLQGCSQRAAGMWPPCFFRRDFVHLGASMAVPVGRKSRGWMQPAVVAGTAIALGGAGRELRSSTVILAYRPPFYCKELWMMVQKLFSGKRVKKALGYQSDCCFWEKSNLSNIQSATLHLCWKSEELLETNHTYGDMAPSLAWVGDKSPFIALACCIGNTYFLGSC